MRENRDLFFPRRRRRSGTCARYQLIALTGRTVEKFVANYLSMTRRAWSKEYLRIDSRKGSGQRHLSV